MHQKTKHQPKKILIRQFILLLLFAPLGSPIKGENNSTERDNVNSLASSLESHNHVEELNTTSNCSNSEEYLRLERLVKKLDVKLEKAADEISTDKTSESDYPKTSHTEEIIRETGITQGFDRNKGSVAGKTTNKTVINKEKRVSFLGRGFQQALSSGNLIINALTHSKMEQPAEINDFQLKGKAKAHVVSEEKEIYPLFGVILAVGAAFLVGISFIFQKKGLLKVEANRKSNKQGRMGQFSYLLQWMWWCGMFSMAIGEIMNFVAYSIAPAILITPLGALRVIVSAVLSAMFLNERLNTHGKIGVLLSLVGSVMVIIHAPRREKVKTFEAVVLHFTDTTFLFYCAVLISITVFLIVHAAPKRGKTDIMVYISICNIVGALCVLCGKGLGIALKEMGRLGQEVLLNPIFWVLFVGQVAGIIIQIIYLNKSLAHFNASMVTPIKYVFTNIFLVTGSILLFQEFTYMSGTDIVGMACGFVTVVIGIILLNVFKDNTNATFATGKR